jgi:hypothetical protein
VLPFLHSLEATGIGTIVRESLYGFPILVAIHVMGLVLSVGTLMWFDLRLLGVALQSAAVSRVYRRLMPWTFVGFTVMVLSGALLFTGYASSAYGNVYFRIKVATIIVAATNAAFYHLFTERNGHLWDANRVPPAAARRAGLVSLIAWAVVILCGRMMAYTMY